MIGSDRQRGQAQQEGLFDQTREAVNAELLHELSATGINCFRTDLQRQRDLFRRLPVAQHLQDDALAIAQGWFDSLATVAVRRSANVQNALGCSGTQIS